MDSLVSRKAAAEFLGLSTRTLDRMRSEGELAGYSYRSVVKYDLADLKNYVSKRRDKRRRSKVLDSITYC